MNRRLLMVLSAALAASIAASGIAQPGAGQMSPQAQAKMQAWRKWNDNHKNIGAVQRTLRGIGELNRDPKTALTPAQAQKILAALKPWRTKPKMTDEQASKLNKQITAPLTIAQLKKLASMPRRGGGMMGGGRGPGGGGPGGGGARTGGGPGGNGPRRAFDPSRIPNPAEYNPINPATSPMAKGNPEMAKRSKQRMDQLFAGLAARAAGKPVKK